MLERQQERAYTWDDLAAMPEDNLRREIIGGMLEMTPAPGYAHQKLVLRIARAIEDAAGALGETLVAPSDVILSRFDVVQPDVFFIRGAAAEIVVNDRIARTPDLVVEVISPSSAPTDHVRKFALYATSGVAEYWLVDPGTRTVSLHLLEDGGYLAARPDGAGRLASRVVPGLEIDAARLFTGLPEGA
ncbi:MAG: Uma2 family endonuclease [Chloroflexota bacterium]